MVPLGIAELLAETWIDWRTSEEADDNPPEAQPAIPNAVKIDVRSRLFKLLRRVKKIIAEFSLIPSRGQKCKFLSILIAA